MPQPGMGGAQSRSIETGKSRSARIDSMSSPTSPVAPVRAKSRGPWFGGPFNPTQVQATQVGEVFIDTLDSRNVRITYRIDGVTVTRDATRQTWRLAREALMDGYYVGAMSLIERAAHITHRIVQPTGRFDIEVDATQATIRFEEATATCTFKGPVLQSGKFTSVAGVYNCTDGRAGAFGVTELEVTQHGFSGRLSLVQGSAKLDGTFGGARRK
ncbi:MAG: hypothetical protein HC782_04790 [Gammaproteobacteria bacterium]|nr:hypothetical protein [Gammaproteobacteria bacterium]